MTNIQENGNIIDTYVPICQILIGIAKKFFTIRRVKL